MGRKVSVNAPCPCGSGGKYKKCCGRWHKGAAAPTPEALMRSRYSAYALGLVDYVLQTTHPDGPQHGRYGMREEVERFCREVGFEGLQVLESHADGDRGTVRFHATLSRDGNDVSFSEHSAFRKERGRWYYLGHAPAR